MLNFLLCFKYHFVVFSAKVPPTFPRLTIALKLKHFLYREHLLLERKTWLWQEIWPSVCDNKMKNDYTIMNMNRENGFQRRAPRALCTVLEYPVDLSSLRALDSRLGDRIQLHLPALFLRSSQTIVLYLSTWRHYFPSLILGQFTMLSATINFNLFPYSVALPLTTRCFFNLCILGLTLNARQQLRHSLERSVLGD